MDSNELRQMSITNAKLAMNQGNNYKIEPDVPEVHILSRTQQHCIRTMMSFFKRKGDEYFRLASSPTTMDTIFISGENIKEWLSSVLWEGKYYHSQSHLLNSVRSCWLDNRLS